jgi:Tfp pilus assembly protein FimT
MGKKRQAFTLFELILVCALVALVAAIAWPSLDSFVADARVVAGADMVRARLAEAQARAIEEGRPYRFEILDKNKCRVVPDSGEAGPPPAGNGGPESDPSQGVLGGEDTLPAKVSFDKSRAAGGDPGDQSSGNGLKVVYLPDGSAREDAEISLRSPGARSVTLRLRALTAALTTVREAEGSRP